MNEVSERDPIEAVIASLGALPFADEQTIRSVLKLLKKAHDGWALKRAIGTEIDN